MRLVLHGFALLRLLRGLLIGCVVLPLCVLCGYCIARSTAANCPANDRRRSLTQRCGQRCRLGCRSSCTWVCLAELWFCCVCILGCCVLYPLLPRRKRLALVCCCCCCISGLPLCRFVKCMSSVCVIKDKVMLLYPSGCLNPITLHI